MRDTAGLLAERWGADRDKAMLAGLLHDITKNCGDDFQLELLGKYGFTSDSVLMSSKGVWHSVTGAFYIRDILGINDPEIFDAVRYHTTGRSGMTLLDKVVYIADFIEPSRDYKDVDKVRRIAFENIDKACLEGVKYCIKKGLSKLKPVYGDTFSFYNDLICKGDAL